MACCVVGDKDTQQRSVVQVDPFFTVVDLMQEVLSDIGRVRIDCYLFDGKSGFAENDLNRFRHSLPEESSTQDVMTIDDSLHRRDATIQQFPVAECDHGRRLIRVGVLSEEVVEEDAFLEWSERVDILHVGHAARDLKE